MRATTYCPPSDWHNQVLDEVEPPVDWGEVESLEELERVLDAGYLDA